MKKIQLNQKTKDIIILASCWFSIILGFFIFALFIEALLYVSLDAPDILAYVEQVEHSMQVDMYSATGLDCCVVWGYIMIMFVLPFSSYDCIFGGLHARREYKKQIKERELLQEVEYNDERRD